MVHSSCEESGGGQCEGVKEQQEGVGGNLRLWLGRREDSKVVTIIQQARFLLLHSQHGEGRAQLGMGHQLAFDLFLISR